MKGLNKGLNWKLGRLRKQLRQLPQVSSNSPQGLRREIDSSLELWRRPVFRPVSFVYLGYNLYIYYDKT